MSFQITRFQLLLIIWPQYLSCLMLYIPKYLGSVRELELRGPAPWSGWLQNIYIFKVCLIKESFQIHEDFGKQVSISCF